MGRGRVGREGGERGRERIDVVEKGVHVDV